MIAGTEEIPFQYKLRIVLFGVELVSLYNQRQSSSHLTPGGIGVYGDLMLHSEINGTWTMLKETATAHSNQIILLQPVDWKVNDEIVITSTSFEAYETETHKIMRIEGGTKLTLNTTLKHDHLAVMETVGNVDYHILAEVGLLTRSITIENGDSDGLSSQRFRCHVYIGEAGNRNGSIQLQGVGFKGCGHAMVEADDNSSRSALTFVNASWYNNTFVRQCSFHSSYSTAIQIIGTNNLDISGNVIHDTIGPSMVVAGKNHNIVNNLASMSHFNGTYHDSTHPLRWIANFEITAASGITFTHNHAAGGAMAGIHTSGEDCTKSDSIIRHNVAHSTLHCFHAGYSDTTCTECSRHYNITAFACNHYGFFSYSPSEIQLIDSTFINNKVAIYISVIGPNALSHQVSTKTVSIERVKIISASKTFDCFQDEILPKIAKDLDVLHSVGLLSPSGGHVGIVHPTFVSTQGGYPSFAWPSIRGYPAIAGRTNINQVSFTNFGLRCRNNKDVVIMTNKYSEDANHPVYLKGITFESDGRFTSGCDKINEKYKVFVHEPNLASVNPADCGDLDCDGMKAVILTDVDGRFTETNSFHTIISKAEFEWDGDSRRGLGDYRIPEVMLSRRDGSHISIDENYPLKGVVRSRAFGGNGDCSFNQDWNMYLCEYLEHLLLVLESLDVDTEVRRVSPVGISANGYINILNGPKDHGWCGGYTCQERISTLYGIIASSFNYTIGFNSTNPQKLALHLLNANNSQGILVRILYTNLQRLDVFINDGHTSAYVPPKNANVTLGGNLMYDFATPKNHFFPNQADAKGANYFDRSLKELHINIKGSHSYSVISSPVILLSLTLISDENVVNQLIHIIAEMLAIPTSRIRIVAKEVNDANDERRKKRATGPLYIKVEFEIGDPPFRNVPDEESNTEFNGGVNIDANVVSNITATLTTTNNTVVFSHSNLIELLEVLTEAVQTGTLTQGIQGTLLNVEVEQPPPVPSDPTGGKRATNTTGGPQPGDPGTNTLQTYSENQWLSQRNSKPLRVRLSLPSNLTTTREISGSPTEGIPLSKMAAPQFTLYDNNNTVAETLGFRIPWKMKANILSGPEQGSLFNNEVEFVMGRAFFQGMVFSHPGTYHLEFKITVPKSANFYISLDPIEVNKRPLSLLVYQQPQNGNTTFSLYPYPTVRLADSGTHLLEHNWRNSTWYITAALEKGNHEWTVELKKGEATFRNIRILTSGQHRLVFRAVTTPKPTFESLLPTEVKSTHFNISIPDFTRLIVTYQPKYKGTVESNEAEFISNFLQIFRSQYIASELFNTSLRAGTAELSTFVTSRDINDLVDILDHLETEGTKVLTLKFQNLTLVPISVIQDSNYLLPIQKNNSNILALTISTSMSGITGIILLISGLIVMGLYCRRKVLATKHRVRI